MLVGSELCCRKGAKKMARGEIAESSFEYLLCEILALDPPNTQEIEQVVFLHFSFRLMF